MHAPTCHLRACTRAVINVRYTVTEQYSTSRILYLLLLACMPFNMMIMVFNIYREWLVLLGSSSRLSFIAQLMVFVTKQQVLVRAEEL
jgi:hypothetical protein